MKCISYAQKKRSYSHCQVHGMLVGLGRGLLESDERFRIRSLESEAVDAPLADRDASCRGRRRCRASQIFAVDLYSKQEAGEEEKEMDEVWLNNSWNYSRRAPPPLERTLVPHIVFNINLLLIRVRRNDSTRLRWQYAAARRLESRTDWRGYFSFTIRGSKENKQGNVSSMRIHCGVPSKKFPSAVPRLGLLRPPLNINRQKLCAMPVHVSWYEQLISKRAATSQPFCEAASGGNKAREARGQYSSVKTFATSFLCFIGFSRLCQTESWECIFATRGHVCFDWPPRLREVSIILIFPSNSWGGSQL